MHNAEFQKLFSEEEANELIPRLEILMRQLQMQANSLRERIDELAVDGGFLDWLDHLAADLNDYLGRPLWYQQQQDNGAAMPNGIAYFSMEFGVAEVLPNYSGGLGILAGDHLKSASDLGLPLIAVGLYYRSGYFRQSLTADGWQHETYPALDPQASFIPRISHMEAIQRRLAVMDATALTLCMENRLPIHVFNMDDPANIARILAGEQVGTLVATPPGAGG